MKNRLLLSILMFFSVLGYGQTIYPYPNYGNKNILLQENYRQINKYLRIPHAPSTTPIFNNGVDSIGSGVQVTTDGYFNISKGLGVGFWKYPNLDQVNALIAASGGASNLALGTATTTTQPITNSNGTGFTLVGSVAGVSAGLQSAADKTKLDAITGTNTGNQSLTQSSSVAGQFQMSGAGGTITLYSLFPNSTPDWNYTALSGLTVTTNTTGSTNYPSASGVGLVVARSGASAVGRFDIWKANTATDDLYFRTGSGVSTFNNTDIIAGRTWVQNEILTDRAVNTTTTALSSANLNASYANVRVGYRVICHLITGSPAIYTKATEAGSSDVWLTSAVTVTP